MKRLYFLLFLGALFLPVVITAQPLDEIPYKFKLEAADTSFARLDFYNAADWYEQCYKESRDPAIAQRIAICHDKMRDYSRAERWYQRIVQKDTATEFPDLKFEYGRLLKKNAKYDEAEEVFNELLASGKAMNYKDRIENELVGVVMARTLKVPDDLLIENIGNKVNSRNSEASPALDEEGNLFYISFDQDEIVKVTNKNDDHHAKILEARKDQKGG
jgi:tetratricopeptide (TPR) repeat protein